MSKIPMMAGRSGICLKATISTGGQTPCELGFKTNSPNNEVNKTTQNDSLPMEWIKLKVG
jgi:hypothetical protein